MKFDRRVGELALAGAWIALGAGLIWLTFDMRQAAANDPLGPAFLPRITGAILIVVGAWVGGRAARRGEQTRDENEDRDAEERGLVEDRPVRAIAAIGIVLGYVVAMPLVGYVAATILASMALLAIQGARGGMVIALPVALSVVLFVVFSTVLSVRFP